MRNTLEKYQKTRERTEKLCQPLENEDYVAQPIIDVSPPKWHLGHTTWFFENFVLKNLDKDYKVFNEKYDFIFNSYYESQGERVSRVERGNLTRPCVKEIYDYRAYVDKHLLEAVSERELDTEVYKTIELGLQHEQQHQELLLTDIKYILSKNPLYPIYDKNFLEEGEKSQNLDKDNAKEYIKIEEGIYEVGNTGEEFCFDNETGRHKVYLNSYQICNELITNGEYLEFIKDGGYKNFSYWLSEGWEWVKNNNISHPEYWKNINGEWYHFTLNGLQKLDKERTLTHVSFYEAQAFAQWRGERLPTEYEWEVAAPKFQWGKRWEWTYSAYHPYPNFKKWENAIGEYNGKFMINQIVLRGASIATAPEHNRVTYRNFFHPYLRWQYNGIRLVK